MALITTCPNCNTQFHIVPDQLKLRSGMVRCGQCREIFNAANQLGQTVVEPVVVAESSQVSVTVQELTSQEVALQHIPTQEVPLHEQDANFTQILPASHKETVHDPLQPSVKKQYTRLLIAALGFALLVCALYLAHTYRYFIATQVPQTIPVLNYLCTAPKSCMENPAPYFEPLQLTQLSLKRDVSVLGESSTDFVLIATLSNPSILALQWPRLEINFTDTQGKSIATRMLNPKDYLTDNKQISAGLLAGEEWEVRLPLTLDAATVGYIGRILPP